MLIEALNDYVEQHADKVRELLRRYTHSEKKLFLRSDLWDEFKLFCVEIDDESMACSPLADILSKTQEAIMTDSWFCLATRPRVARWRYLRFHLSDLRVEQFIAADYMKFKEGLVTDRSGEWALEIDLGPFETFFPKMTQPRSIGRGVEYLNRHLSGRLFIILPREMN